MDRQCGWSNETPFYPPLLTLDCRSTFVFKDAVLTPCESIVWLALPDLQSWALTDLAFLSIMLAALPHIHDPRHFFF